MTLQINRLAWWLSNGFECQGRLQVSPSAGHQLYLISNEATMRRGNTVFKNGQVLDPARNCTTLLKDWVCRFSDVAVIMPALPPVRRSLLFGPTRKSQLHDIECWCVNQSLKSVHFPLRICIVDAVRVRTLSWAFP